MQRPKFLSRIGGLLASTLPKASPGAPNPSFSSQGVLRDTDGRLNPESSSILPVSAILPRVGAGAFKTYR